MDELLMERYELCKERILSIKDERKVVEPYQDYFSKTAEFIGMILSLNKEIESGRYKNQTQAELQGWNVRLYEDILDEHYDTSYGNPAYACEQLGEYGQLLCFLYAEIRGMIVFAFEKRIWDVTVLCELFIQIYNDFEDDELPAPQNIQEIICADVSDYCDDMMHYRIKEMVDPTLSFAADIIMDSDLNDLRYLYRYGEFISKNELETARFLNTLPEEEIESMARTYTQGYKIGFENNGIDLRKKKTVNIRYRLGFERMIRAAIRQFYEMGLEPVIYRSAAHSVNKKQHLRTGYYGGIPNKQFDYDHRGDAGLYMTDAFISKKLRALQHGFENEKELANGHAGPAVVEVFGEESFVPQSKEQAIRLSEKQQKMQVHYDNEAGQIINRYIIGEERSFTIIAYPIPEIGEQFVEIFQETVKINTFDYKLYQRIQQKIIDTLDQGERVHIKGSNGNRTDLYVQLCKLEDQNTQTIFENCVADVNIPVGEVFTTPMLKGTNGTLHVSSVYLNELNYKELEITFTDGMITGYQCSNFENEEENQAYIRENVLHHHETLPIGEFAIGTNTTAYMVSKKYQIADKLPILIAEKMGPHFAVGDTCYSWSEDTKVYNSDKKEIIARDNEISILRKTDVSKAYFGCHTDITVPYEELEYIRIETANGREISIIENGRFALPGTEELNKPFSS